MPLKIAIIQGHPDPSPERFCRAIEAAYAEGAEAAGHEVRRIDIAALDFPVLRTETEWHDGRTPEALKPCQETLLWAQHYVLIYPLWMGTMPALMKAFLEQVLRPDLVEPESPGMWARPFKGRSARIIVTMGMPAPAYRWYFGAHSLRSLERNVLAFAGIGPIRDTLFGQIEAGGAAKAKRRLELARRLGRRGR